MDGDDNLKKKIFDYTIIFSICFIVAPLLLYCFLASSLFDKYNLYFSNKFVYLYMYLIIATIGAITFILVKLSKYFIKNIVNTRPIIKAELISIEKVDIKALTLGILEVDPELEDVYDIKFKHNNEIIHTTISKHELKKDLVKDEHPYVEYQYFYLTNIFNKFHNIKVHTKK